MVLEERLSQARGRVIAPAQIVVAAALVTPGDRLVGDPPLKYPSEGLCLHAYRSVRVHLSIKRPIAPFALNMAIRDCKRRRRVEASATTARRASLHTAQVPGRDTNVGSVERIWTLRRGNVRSRRKQHRDQHQPPSASEHLPLYVNGSYLSSLDYVR